MPPSTPVQIYVDGWINGLVDIIFLVSLHANCIIVLVIRFVDSTGETERGQSSEANLAHHVLVCALHELGCLVQSLGTSSAPLITEPSAGQFLLLLLLQMNRLK